MTRGSAGRVEPEFEGDIVPSLAPDEDELSAMPRDRGRTAAGGTSARPGRSGSKSRRRGRSRAPASPARRRPR